MCVRICSMTLNVTSQIGTFSSRSLLHISSDFSEITKEEIAAEDTVETWDDPGTCEWRTGSTGGTVRVDRILVGGGGKW